MNSNFTNIIIIAAAIVILSIIAAIVFYKKRNKKTHVNNVDESKSRQMIGDEGEQEVAKILEDAKVSNHYRVINNVLLFGGTNKSTQIDHIVIGRPGIYIIETKNYSGDIYVEEGDDWYQKSDIEKACISFNSPENQNLCHMYRLAEAIGLTTNKYTTLITAFPNDTKIHNNTKMKVLHFDEILHELFSHVAHNIPDATVDEIYDLINKANTMNNENLRKHIARISRTY